MAENNDLAKCGGTCEDWIKFREGFTGRNDPCDRCSLADDTYFDGSEIIIGGRS